MMDLRSATFTPDKTQTIFGDFWEMHMARIEMKATRNDTMAIDNKTIDKLLKTSQQPADRRGR